MGQSGCSRNAVQIAHSKRILERAGESMNEEEGGMQDEGKEGQTEEKKERLMSG